ncbi:hypothetical protein CsatA_028732 [Cannabis sativa]
MASSSYQRMEAAENMAIVTIDDEEEAILSYDASNTTGNDYDDRWCIVGRFLTERSIDFDAMQHLMASLWQPGKGMFIKELDTNRYLFQFYHELDNKSMIDRSPWMFNKFLLTFKRLRRGEDSRMLELNEVDMWVQLRDLRSGFKTATIVMNIANYIGKFVESDEKNFLGLWRDYLRVRVTINVTRPLKRLMKLRNTEGIQFWVNFKYEHLPTLCFICGIMGHSDKFCPRRFDVPDGRIVKRYGEWMRVKPVRKNHTIGAKWLKQFMVGMEDDIGNDAAMAVGLVHHSKAREESATGRGITIPVIVEENMGQQVDKCGQVDRSMLTRHIPINVERDMLTELNHEINPQNEEDCLLVVNSKRRRMELGLTDRSKEVRDEVDMNQVEEGSTNTCSVGIGIQAHRPL